MVHHPDSLINSSTSRTQPPVSSPTPAPVTTSPLSCRTSTGSPSHNASTSRSFSSPTRPSITRPPPTSQTAPHSFLQPPLVRCKSPLPSSQDQTPDLGGQSLLCLCPLPLELTPQKHP
ncbi:hypothetical protein PBY51_023957 [Eleginops maclovinus]|uniref:Uncharacterized protein n=1 Tax=Eleginops maclovinus TaxID=56733 RepID=A0AAN7X1G5_ELEMC|nr:hypothetical protein PBY51_023957 [Eleginops maclovinus]